MTITCPVCFGRCDVNEIQLEMIETESADFFLCKKCKRLFEVVEVSKETLEDTWNEEFLAELQSKIDDACQEASE